ncbi:MAG: hypothetical protein JWN17_1449 [Frankiales bacterium]|nr:hypothetical protein [Frankiales bacterium]
MSAPRPVLRVALAGLLATVLGLVGVAAPLLVLEHRYTTARAAATATAAGTVVADDLGDSGDVRVRWVDAAGRTRTQRFGVYDTDRYRTGRSFAVRYDPAHPDRAAFPGDPDETSAEDDLVVPTGIAAVVAVLLVLPWLLRGGLFRLRLRRPGVRLPATLLSWQRPTSGPLDAGGSGVWLSLDAPEGPRLQRVLWHPALDAAPEALEVWVHGSTAGHRRVAVVLPSGEALVPVGRLRHAPPRTGDLVPRRETVLDLDEVFLLPPGTSLPPASPWWSRGARYGAAAAVVGLVLGFLLGGGGAAVLPFTAGTVGVVLSLWALGGGEP